MLRKNENSIMAQRQADWEKQQEAFKIKNQIQNQMQERERLRDEAQDEYVKERGQVD